MSLIFNVVAVVQDLRTGKIKNRLIMAGMFMAFFVKVVTAIMSYTAYRTLISCVMLTGNLFFLFLILFPLYQVGALGAGDCKLLLMIGLYFSIKKTIVIITGALVLAAIYGMARNLMRCMLLKKEWISGICFSVPILVMHILVVIYDLLGR